MILNVWTITSLFLAVVSMALALIAARVAASGLRARRAGSGPAELEAAEARANLLALLVGVLLIVRLVSWPQFYFLLKSFVPDLTSLGVMCTYGVTRIQPGLVRALEVLKPLTLFVLGFWWLLELVNRRTPGRRLAGPSFTLTLVAAGLVLAECATEGVYLFAKKTGKPVTCCSQFLDTGGSSLRPDRAWFEASVIGIPGSALLVTYVLHLAVITGAILLARRARRGGAPLAGARPLALAAAGLVNLAATRVAWHDSVAPRVLQLPYHHCVYELLTDIPVMGFAAMLTVAGTAGLAWPALLGAWGRRAPGEIVGIQARVYSLAVVALASALLVVTILLV